MNGWFKFRINQNERVHGSTTDGRYHLSFKNLVPEEVMPYFISCSARVAWEQRTFRITGVYQFAAAVGTLDVYLQAHKGQFGEENVERQYVLEIESKNIEDCKELVRLVRAGLIMPTESWEAPQTPMKSRWQQFLFWLQRNRREMQLG